MYCPTCGFIGETSTGRCGRCETSTKPQLKSVAGDFLPTSKGFDLIIPSKRFPILSFCALTTIAFSVTGTVIVTFLTLPLFPLTYYFFMGGFFPAGIAGFLWSMEVIGLKGFLLRMENSRSRYIFGALTGFPVGFLGICLLNPSNSQVISFAPVGGIVGALCGLILIKFVTQSKKGLLV